VVRAAATPASASAPVETWVSVRPIGISGDVSAHAEGTAEIRSVPDGKAVRAGRRSVRADRAESTTAVGVSFAAAICAEKRTTSASSVFMRDSPAKANPGLQSTASRLPSTDTILIHFLDEIWTKFLDALREHPLIASIERRGFDREIA
jgi:hypothetical protein